jgi:hypothetical protein
MLIFLIVRPKINKVGGAEVRGGKSTVEKGRERECTEGKDGSPPAGLASEVGKAEPLVECLTI